MHILHVNHFHFFVIILSIWEKTLLKMYRQFMEMSVKDQWNAALKIKLFFFFLSRFCLCAEMLYATIESQAISLIIVVSHALILFNFVLGHSYSGGSNWVQHKECKKVWKRNIDEIYDFEQNPIMQLWSQLHTHWTTLISTSMTMQLANSDILTVGVFVYIFFSLSFSSSSNTITCKRTASLAHIGPVIIFDNFSDKKIARDKLL